MALQENVSSEIRFVDEVTWGVAPSAATTVQSLRRVSSTLSLTKDTYASAEVRTDRQIQDFRHGVRRGAGDISGELSPATYESFMEAACRGTWAAQADVTQATGAMSSATLSVASNVISASGGSFITAGLTVGMVIRLTAGFVAGNMNKNLTIVAITATTLTVVGATLTDEAGPIATWTIDVPGKSVYIPASGHVNRSFAVEINYPDIDVSELYTGIRVGRMQIGLPASGMATATFGLMGKDAQYLSGANAPYFTGTVTAPTSTGILAAVNGSLLVAGVAVGVVTGMEITMDLAPQSDAVVGSNSVPAIFLGTANVTGNMTVLFQDDTFLQNFDDETEVSVMLRMDVDSSANSDFIQIVLPRIKFGTAGISRQGNGGIPVTMSFQALKKATTTGWPATTLLIQDSLVS
jgi:hypothetical protein